MVGCFDDEEIGSLLRQGANSNHMSSVIERIAEASTTWTDKATFGANLLSQTLANSFLVSSDVIHAVDSNFRNAYLENHSPSQHRRRHLRRQQWSHDDRLRQHSPTTADSAEVWLHASGLSDPK